jgi:hypothetical protein
LDERLKQDKRLFSDASISSGGESVERAVAIRNELWLRVFGEYLLQGSWVVHPMDWRPWIERIIMHQTAKQLWMNCYHAVG